MGFSRQEYWSGVPLPSLLSDLSNPVFRFPFFLRILFIYFWLCRVSLAAYRLSLAVASRGYSLAACGLLIGVTSLVVENGL